VDADMSFRGRLAGRGGAAFALLDGGGLEGWRTADGGGLADIEGEGEDLDELTPFVCMPGGTGRLIFDVMFDCTAVTTGAIGTLNAPSRSRRQASQRRRLSCQVAALRVASVNGDQKLSAETQSCGERMAKGRQGDYMIAMSWLHAFAR
jgi:hypothetical protein